MAERELILLGAGGHAKVVIAAAQSRNAKVVAIYDDNPEKWGKLALGVPILGPLGELERGHALPAILALGDNRTRQAFAARFHRLAWETLVDASAVVHPSARLGEGTVVFAGAVIHPDAELGRHCIVNTAATVDHDCRTGDYVHLAPGVHLAGAVELGEGAFMGVASSAIPRVRIGAWSTVAAGGVVVKDLPSDVLAMGVPARIAGPSA